MSTRELRSRTITQSRGVASGGAGGGGKKPNKPSAPVKGHYVQRTTHHEKNLELAKHANLLKIVKKKGPPSLTDLIFYQVGLFKAKEAGVKIRDSLAVFVDPNLGEDMDVVPSSVRGHDSTWRPNRLGKDVNYYSHNNIIPAILGNFSRSSVAETTPCRNCANGNGPFTECTIVGWLDEHNKLVFPLGEACMNCLFGGNPKSCSFHDGSSKSIIPCPDILLIAFPDNWEYNNARQTSRTVRRAGGRVSTGNILTRSQMQLTRGHVCTACGQHSTISIRHQCHGSGPAEEEEEEEESSEDSFHSLE